MKKQKKYESLDKRLNYVYSLLELDYEKLMDSFNFITESTIMNRLEDDLVDLEKKFNAAREGLRLVNKLNPGERKLYHTKRVMSNLSVLRTSILNVERKIQEFIKAA